MIDAEKLLGGLIRKSLAGGLRSRGRRRRNATRSSLQSLLGSGMGRIAGMGALGLAIAAFDHFVGKSGQSQPATSAGFAGGSPTATTSRAPAVPPPPPPGTPYQRQQSDALLLIQAMIAAANADGTIDEKEQSAILGKLDEAGMNSEERQFIRSQLASPVSIDSILPQVDTPDLASQMYAVSLLAIRVDTRAERDYLNYLQSRLGLGKETVEELERVMETVEDV